MVRQRPGRRSTPHRTPRPALGHRHRAASQRRRKYGALKAILRKGLDFEPLPNVVPVATTPLAAPRFARNVRELLHYTKEDWHEPR
jgi:hypothetical protein